MKNNNFDLLRLFAALQVVLAHASSHILSEFNYSIDGTSKMILTLTSYIPGVPVFFLISGFLIAMSYEKNSNLKEYTKNRILRIYPALYINIFISVIILYYFGFVQFNLELFSWLFAQMSIVQFYNADMFRGFGVGVINGSLWTISVELTFYITLPIIFYLYKKSRFIIGLLFFSSFMIWIYDTAILTNFNNRDFFGKLLHVSIVPYLFLFFIGIGFYRFYNNLKKFIEDKFLLWFLIFIMYNIIVNNFNITSNFIIYIFKWITFSFMIFAFAFSFKDLSRKLLRGNDFTYGIYIYHMLIINVFIYLKMVADIKYFIFVVVLSIFFGILSWYVVEKPFLRLKKHSLFKEMHNL